MITFWWTHADGLPEGLINDVSGCETSKMRIKMFFISNIFVILYLNQTDICSFYSLYLLFMWNFDKII